jgi:cell division protein FtsL
VNNLAQQLRKEKNIEVEQSPKSTPKKKLNKFRITPIEKLLLLVCSVAITSVAVMYISNTASIFAENHNIQKLQGQVGKQEKINRDLHLQVTELSSPERIRKIAEEQLGMKLDSKKVKFVGK